MAATRPRRVDSTAAAQLERTVAAATRRSMAARERASELEAGRDDAIRAAHAGGVPPRRLVEITGLSRKRIDQIRRGARL